MSLARPREETSYRDQDLQHYTKIYGVRLGIVLYVLVAVACFLTGSG